MSGNGRRSSTRRGSLSHRLAVVEEIKEIRAQLKKKRTELRSIDSGLTDEQREVRRRRLSRQFLKENIVYFLFVVVFLLAMLLPSSGSRYYWMSAQLRDYFIDEEFPQEDSNIPKTFNDIASLEEFWQYMRDVFSPQIYAAGTWYNGNKFPADQPYLLYQNMIVGAIRFRQVKMEREDCPVPYRMRKWAPGGCFLPYSPSYEQKDDLPGPYNEYHDSSSSSGRGYWGTLDTYDAGGYYADLPSNNEAEGKRILDLLYNNTWIDRSTRAAFVDFTLYNGNTNLFSVIRLAWEFPATGGVIPSSVFRTIRFFIYVDTLDYFVLVFELLVVVMTVYFTICEVIEMFEKKGAYFISVWNYIEWIVIFMLYFAFAFHIKNIVDRDDLKTDPEPTEYVDFQPAAFWTVQESNMLSVMAFLVIFKIVKPFRIFPRFRTISGTLVRSLRDIATFMFIGVIVFIGFAITFYILIGHDVRSYSTVPWAMSTLFSAILGDFNFTEVTDANRVLGPLLFVSFMVFVYFVLVNMVIAILSGKYEETQEELRGIPDPRNEDARLTKEGLKKMLKGCVGMCFGRNGKRSDEEKGQKKYEKPPSATEMSTFTSPVPSHDRMP